MAQGATRLQIQNADLILHCHAANDNFQSFDLNVDRSRTERWLVVTKSDMVSHHVEQAAIESNHERKYATSIFQPESIGHLLGGLSRWAKESYERTSQVVPQTAIRCRSSLERVQDALSNAFAAAEHHAGDEIIASELRLALDEIGLVTGTVYNDDILDALFSRFCIGK
jgi:tRNA modification GTPase